METLSPLAHFQEMQPAFRDVLLVEPVCNCHLVGSEDLRDVRSPFIVPFDMLVLPVLCNEPVRRFKGIGLIRPQLEFAP